MLIIFLWWDMKRIKKQNIGNSPTLLVSRERAPKEKAVMLIIFLCCDMKRIKKMKHWQFANSTSFTNIVVFFIRPKKMENDWKFLRE